MCVCVCCCCGKGNCGKERAGRFCLFIFFPTFQPTQPLATPSRVQNAAPRRATLAHPRRVRPVCRVRQTAASRARANHAPARKTRAQTPRTVRPRLHAARPGGHRVGRVLGHQVSSVADCDHVHVHGFPGVVFVYLPVDRPVKRAGLPRHVGSLARHRHYERHVHAGRAGGVVFHSEHPVPGGGRGKRGREAGRRRAKSSCPADHLTHTHTSHTPRSPP